MSYATAQQKHNRTVVVVDDINTELNLFRTYLIQAGFRVITANNAVDALERIRQDHPDVIISDVLMPEHSGYELCRALKRDPEIADIPVIFCSSKSSSVDRAWGMTQGAQAYLCKPFTEKELLDTLNQVIP